MSNKEAVENALEVIKSTINSYEAMFFTCEGCGRLAFMIDPGDGITSHASVSDDGVLRFSEID